MAVYEETGLYVIDVHESADNPRHYQVKLAKGSGNTYREVTVRKQFGSPERVPFDSTKTYAVTVTEE